MSAPTPPPADQVLLGPLVAWVRRAWLRWQAICDEGDDMIERDV